MEARGCVVNLAIVTSGSESEFYPYSEDSEHEILGNGYPSWEKNSWIGVRFLQTNNKAGKPVPAREPICRIFLLGWFLGL